MRKDRVAYLLFVLIGFTELGVMALDGDNRIDKGGVVLILGLVYWLGRHSRTAWWLFVFANAWVLILGVLTVVSGVTQSGSSGGLGQPTASVGHSGVLWGNAIAFLVGSVLLLAILVSEAMQNWVKPATAA